MEKKFDCRELLSGQYDFACQRPDGSVYPINPSHTCRQGVPVDPKSVGITRENWRQVGAVYGPETDAAVKTISANLDKLSSKDRAAWEGAIPDMIVDTKICVGTSKLDSDGSPITVKESEFDKQMAKRVNGYNQMLVDGPPSYIQRRNGDIEPADSLVPTVSNRGGGRWVDTKSGLRFGHKTGEDTLTQMSAGKIDRERRIDDAVKFKDTTLGKSGLPKNSLGTSWPAQSLPGDRKLNSDDIIKGLSKSERHFLSINGLSATKHGSAQKEIFDKVNKAGPEQDRRVKEIVDRYVKQGGRSGVTGKPVSLPGVKPKPGEEQGTVDHLNPISKAKGSKDGGSYSKTKSSFDNFKNFLIAEEGLNEGRGNREWGGEVTKMKKIADADRAKSSTAPTPPKFVGLRGRGASSAAPTPPPAPRAPSIRKASNRAKVEPKSPTNKKSTLSKEQQRAAIENLLKGQGRSNAEIAQALKNANL